MPGTPNGERSAIVIGAGPGIGRSVALRFAREGLPVAVLARSRATVDAALSAPADSGGVRALAELLAGEYETPGIHVVTVTVAGAVAPGTAFDPDEIAEEYWRLHVQPQDAWEHEILYTARR